MINFQTDPKNVDLNLQARRIQFPVRNVDSFLGGLTFLTTIFINLKNSHKMNCPKYWLLMYYFRSAFHQSFKDQCSPVSGFTYCDDNLILDIIYIYKKVWAYQLKSQLFLSKDFLSILNLLYTYVFDGWQKISRTEIPSFLGVEIILVSYGQ